MLFLKDFTSKNHTGKGDHIPPQKQKSTDLRIFFCFLVMTSSLQIIIPTVTHNIYITNSP
jgi:hypothetical protein